MTNEEAAKILYTVLSFGRCDCQKEEIEECLKMAIKALEQQPCEDDCISRYDVLTNLRLNWRLYESAEDAIKMSIYDVSNMDSINPKQAKAEIEKEESAKDCISRAGALRHRHLIYDDDGIGYSVVRVDEIMALPSVTPHPRWIPVSERLPEEETDVLICNRNGDIALSRGSYSTEVENDFIWYTSGWRFGKVIAWMPLPKPYKAESEEEA